MSSQTQQHTTHDIQTMGQFNTKNFYKTSVAIISESES